jgi:hypothetical protein
MPRHPAATSGAGELDEPRQAADAMLTERGRGPLVAA